VWTLFECGRISDIVNENGIIIWFDLMMPWKRVHDVIDQKSVQTYHNPWQIKQSAEIVFMCKINMYFTGEH
jgi:hypothetical protein